MDAVNSYSCSCASGFEGIHCETNINECSSNPCQHGGTCSDGVNLYSCACPLPYYGTSCQDVGVRLAGSSSANEGRVEILYSGSWGTVCDDGFADVSAGVVCRMLGYNSGSAFCCAYFGQGTGSIVLDDVVCGGFETNIFDCPKSLTHNCGHGEDVSVVCV
ncbi:scavenger receptor cysteine-rich domain superfamily protein-like [Lytechinus variegatus]|uniref:scavenger receptor cysteine-rich domain superfamily protein-like n=1 Tax=Lytechinus variegatus TaxID=7654 RepID=UPI001BB14915|nr:scavenger receptor cysteine-rich domain superfamily protein-like [Lytechinus variegatus]